MSERRSLPYTGVIVFLLAVLLFLSLRLVYTYLADRDRFPVNRVKVISTPKYMTQQQLDQILEKYWQYSFFSFPVASLEKELSSCNFIEKAEIEREWPDILKIKLSEKVAVAFWKKGLLMEDGRFFDDLQSTLNNELPHLSGPENKQQEVLQIYKKMSKILSLYGLSIASVKWRENQSWDLVLTNGVALRLGKQDLEPRIIRFCKAWPAVFAAHSGQLVSVDLRYPRGMAVEWKK